MQIIITGGSGFIGFHLAQFHIQRGDNVFLFDNFFKQEGQIDPEFADLVENTQVRFYNFDMTLPFSSCSELTSIPYQFDVVYHLAAINGTRLFYEIPYQLARTNLLLTLNLLDWLENFKVNRLVYSSSSEVYAGAEAIGKLEIPTKENVPVVFPQPTNVRFSYGTTKFMGEFLCSNFGEKHSIPTTVIRYHNIYGPRMGNKHVIPEFIMRIASGEDPFTLNGQSETRAFCYVEDAVEATFQVADHSICAGEIIHIGNSSEEITIGNLAKLVMREMDIDRKIDDLGRISGSVSRRCPNTSKLKELTGFNSKVSLKNGIKRTTTWYLKTLSRSI